MGLNQENPPPPKAQHQSHHHVCVLVDQYWQSSDGLGSEFYDQYNSLRDKDLNKHRVTTKFVSIIFGPGDLSWILASWPGSVRHCY
jgi:hypothetical protein